MVEIPTLILLVSKSHRPRQPEPRIPPDDLSPHRVVESPAYKDSTFLSSTRIPATTGLPPVRRHPGSTDKQTGG